MRKDAEVHDGVAFIAGIPLKVRWLRFRRVIGRGSNGVVFEANDTELGRTVAVKVWFKKGTDTAVRRARAEARKLATVPSTKIVAVHHFGTASGMPFTVMEFFPGVTLHDWLEAGPRSFIDRREVWNQISEGLRVLYRAGHHHGDPHWGNILVRESTSNLTLEERVAGKIPAPLGVKLTDLGASTLWGDQRRMAQREATVVWETATRMFSAEQIRSLLDVNGVDAERTVEAIDALVEVKRLLLDVVEGRDEYSRTGARFSISVRVCEAPMFRLAPLIEIAQARGLPSTVTDMLLAEILSGIRAVEDGVSTVVYSKQHDLSFVELKYAARRRRYLAAPRTSKP